MIAMRVLALLGLCCAGLAGAYGQIAVIPYQSEDKVLLFDPEKNKNLALLNVAKAPVGVAISEDDRFTYITHPERGLIIELDLAVKKIAYDTDTLQEKKRAKTGRYPYAIAISADMSAVYVSNQGEDTISRFSYGDLAEQGQIAVGKSPEAIDFIDSKTLLVTNWFSDDLSIVDLALEKEIRRIPAGKSTRAFGRFISR